MTNLEQAQFLRKLADTLEQHPEMAGLATADCLTFRCESEQQFGATLRAFGAETFEKRLSGWSFHLYAQPGASLRAMVHFSPSLQVDTYVERVPLASLEAECPTK